MNFNPPLVEGLKQATAASLPQVFHSTSFKGVHLLLLLPTFRFWCQHENSIFLPSRSEEQKTAPRKPALTNGDGGVQHDKHNVYNELMGMEVFNMSNIMFTMNFHFGKNCV